MSRILLRSASFRSFFSISFIAILLTGLVMPDVNVSAAPGSAGALSQNGNQNINLSGQSSPAPAGSHKGISWTGAAGISETTAQIMARSSIQPQPFQPGPQLFFNRRADLSHKQPNPASLGLRQGSSPGAGTNPLAANGFIAPLSLGITFNGPDYNVVPCNLTPPDTMGAVGPTQFIVTLNCRFVSYNKAAGAADGVLDVHPATFFNSVRNSVGVSDPHIRYDRISGRWFIVMINIAFPDNRIMLAVSNTSTITPSTVWKFFFFQDSISGHTNCLGDYPTPGIDANAIYIGINQFCGLTFNSSTYLTSDGFVVQKGSVLGSGSIQVTAFPTLVDEVTNVGVYTPQGVDNPDPNATEGYFIGNDISTSGVLQLRRISNPGSTTPTISGNVTITTALQAPPPTQPHKGNLGGTAGNLDASDGRLFVAYFRDGSLWTALDSGVGPDCTANGTIDRDAVFWYEITGIPTLSTPAVRQSGAVCDTTASNPAFYSYGTIMVNGQGHAAVGYTIAGNNNFTTPAVSTRLAGDPLGTLTASANLVPTSTFLHVYNPSFDTGGFSGRRWGDFSYTSVDPCDDMTLWTIQEYASSDNIYGVRAGAVNAPPPALPASANANTFAAGQSSIDVVITGTSSSGSGFFDTPASLTDACRKRITASISGGVTVNSVTYTDPTHVTLNISTVGAAPGAKDVTITNPDGQSATGSGLLTVTGAANNTTTAVSATPNPSTFGQSVQFTATVSSGGGTPTGSVTFFDNSVMLGTASLVSGSASYSTAALNGGTHTISATYGGGANFNTSSGSLSGGQTVNPAGTQINLVSIQNPSPINQAVMFTATVTSPGLTPTGSVSFSVDGTPTSVALNGSGIATFISSPLALGSHAVTAVFVANANFAASTPANLTQKVTYMTYIAEIQKSG